MPRVLIVRGHLVTPWELRPWLELSEQFEVRCLLTKSNQFSAPAGLDYVEARALRDFLPGGRLTEVAIGVLGDRYISADEAFEWADIVHAEELGFWFSADAARRRHGHSFRLVQTVWETLPLLEAFRNRNAKRYRRAVLADTDLFLPVTERAAMALILEGVERRRLIVCPPGIDTERFSTAPPAPEQAEHVLLSPGRLVWEKGHQDVIRALALIRRGVVGAGQPAPRLRIIGSGPEASRLRAHAAELGLDDIVEIESVPYDEMPAQFAAASAMILATQGVATAGYHPLDVPRSFWEEQFGMVLAEAMAARLAIISTTSGAVPEVLAGASATLVAPGDWVGLARAIVDGPLSRPPAVRVEYPAEVVARYSTSAAARRLATAYDAVLA